VLGSNRSMEGQRTAGQFFDEPACALEDESARIAPGYHLEKPFLPASSTSARFRSVMSVALPTNSAKSWMPFKTDADGVDVLTVPSGRRIRIPLGNPTSHRLLDRLPVALGSILLDERAAAVLPNPACPLFWIEPYMRTIPRTHARRLFPPPARPNSPYA